MSSELIKKLTFIVKHLDHVIIWVSHNERVLVTNTVGRMVKFLGFVSELKKELSTLVKHLYSVVATVTNNHTISIIHTDSSW